MGHHFTLIWQTNQGHSHRPVIQRNATSKDNIKYVFVNLQVQKNSIYLYNLHPSSPLTVMKDKVHGHYCSSHLCPTVPVGLYSTGHG